ncbi:MAG: CPBP family intramembrane glutamic endopeptidase [Flavipsychrobacter sp.]
MLQLFLLLAMIFTLVSLSFVIAATFTPMITGVEATAIIGMTEDSSREVVNAAMLYQFISSIMAFAGTGFLYAFASHPKPITYLGLKKGINVTQLILASIIAIAAIPLILQIGGLIRIVDLGSYANSLQEAADKSVKAFTNIETYPQLLWGLLVFALTPALGEELLFRGVVLRFIHKRTQSPHHSVILTALLFAFIHFQPYNLIPIFIMGVLLGYLYYYTGSLWISILVHFVYNGSQIYLSYLASTGMIPEGTAEMEHFPAYIILIAVVVAAGAFLLFKKKITPLQPGWSDDFTPQELEERANKNKLN